MDRKRFFFVISRESTIQFSQQKKKIIIDQMFENLKLFLLYNNFFFNLLWINLNKLDGCG